MIGVGYRPNDRDKPLARENRSSAFSIWRMIADIFYHYLLGVCDTVVYCPDNDKDYSYCEDNIAYDIR